MKIVSWNSRFGFDENKAEFINQYGADIYVIQECTNNDVDGLKTYKRHSAWYGDDIDSKYGVGVFSDNYNVELLPINNSESRFIVPFKMYNKCISFTLFAVWAKDKDKNNKKIEYTEQVWNAIHFDDYIKLLSGAVMLIGDFNSNNYWDKQYIQKKAHSHNDIINKLKEYNIESVYHKFNNCENGNEKEPTLLWKMDKNNKFHIDYCFISNNFKIKDIQIGSIDEWEKTKHSDHCPLIIELE
jgi:endonuclease/exonuclease/phosphatase family metal-dependent hydrolase